MTQQVRKGYRNHRKATWGITLGLVVAIAAVVIPIASGAAEKTYTLGLAPSRVCSSTTNGVATTVLKLTNTAKSASLGSAEIFFPAGSIHGVSPPATFRPNATSSFFSGTRDIVALGDLNLSKGLSVSVTVAFKAGSFSGPVSAVVKQSNNFNDTQGGANLFDLDPLQIALPQLAVGACVTVSGTVYLDNDGDGTYDSTGSPADAGQSGWNVKVFDTSSTPAVQVGATAPSGTGGAYTVTGVPIGSSYKVCVSAPPNSGAWGQTAPLGASSSAPERTACSTESSATPAGHLITNLQEPATNRDFGIEQTVAASCTTSFAAPLIGTGSGIVEYRAQLTAPPTLPAGSCKDAVVMYSYLDGSGTPYATIHPPATSTNTTDYWVVERLRWKVGSSGDQNPVDLEYDDSKPYGDVMSTMKMCTADPRAANQLFQIAVDPTTVMPSGPNADGVNHTSCMIQSTDFPSGATYNYEAYTVSIVDGLKTPVG